MGKGKVSRPLQIRKAVAALLLGIGGGKWFFAPTHLELGDARVPPFLASCAQGEKKTHHFPPSLVPGSSLKLSYISILYYTIYTPTLNIPQNTALPFQHLKGFVILAFFSVKQQVLTGHAVEAAACMPQVD